MTIESAVHDPGPVSKSAAGLPRWIVPVVAVAVVVVAGVLLVLMWQWIDRLALSDPEKKAAAQLEAVKVASAFVVGGGGLFALYLAVRRQRTQEQELATRRAELAHAERVAENGRLLAERTAAATEHDAAQRRVTELYTAAAAQLGSDKAPVRLAGIYALERLAQDNPPQRQTIVNVLCAYLRMPFTPPEEPFDDTADEQRLAAHHERVQEREVRLTAQRVLATHLRPGDKATPADTFWAGTDLDLTDAILIDLDLQGCHLRTARFTRTKFAGTTTFGETKFAGDARFVEAEFAGDAWFVKARFAGFASFIKAKFAGTARFVDVEFAGDASFGKAELGKAEFAGDAWFYDVEFAGDAWFVHVEFAGETSFGDTKFAGLAWFSEAKFAGTARFSEAEFTGNTRFNSAKFAGTTSFGKAKFAGDVSFENAEFADEASFSRAEFARTAWFVEAEFAGNVRFLEARFAGTTSFDKAELPNIRYASRSTPEPWSQFAKARFMRGVPAEVARFVSQPDGNTGDCNARDLSGG